MASWREAESRRGFRGRPGALRARRRFVNLVATLLRFPSLGPEAPHRLSASRHDSHRLQPATPPGPPACLALRRCVGGQEERLAGPRLQAALRGLQTHSCGDTRKGASEACGVLTCRVGESAIGGSGFSGGVVAGGGEPAGLPRPSGRPARPAPLRQPRRYASSVSLARPRGAPSALRLPPRLASAANRHAAGADRVLGPSSLRRGTRRTSRGAASASRPARLADAFVRWRGERAECVCGP